MSTICTELCSTYREEIGSSTVSLSNPIQRFVRDVRVLTSHGAIRVEPVGGAQRAPAPGPAPLS
ncbi:hypothetical protein [Streptomyces graminofaciens]|uniref:hypothetical protein n=1 Tax=Streptomyces graminofaciens TaxID=68212 RepID=UPI002572DBDD|nr:hypothetical protein [Streptomyces graminofaciens]